MSSVHGSVEQTVVRRSILGDVWGATPLVLPIRGYLEGVKAMTKGDVYIGRGCRQQGLKRGSYCNNYKVASYGRQAAIKLFEKHLSSSSQLLEQLWTLSGCRLVCHCRPEQQCHGGVIIRYFDLRYPSAYDRDDPSSPAPKTDVLENMAKLRETPESDDG